MWFFFLLGAIVFLIMEHTLLFWVLFVPLGISFVVYLLKFFREGRLGIGHFFTAMFILVAMVVALWIVVVV